MLAICKLSMKSEFLKIHVCLVKNIYGENTQTTTVSLVITASQVLEYTGASYFRGTTVSV